MALLKRLIAGAALVLVLGTGTRAATVDVGEGVPDVTLRDWHGGRAAISERRGRVVLIDFWASWCAMCRTALPALDAIARRHPSVDVLAVSIDGDRGAAERFLAERLPDTAMTLLHDPDGDVFARFGASGMPALYLIDAEGVVRLVESGYVPDRLADVERELERLLSGEKR